MMSMLHNINLNSFVGTISKRRKRVGRGIGSRGRTCGAGDKGQCARSGTSAKRRNAAFGRKLPKIGFISNKVKMLSVNIVHLMSKISRLAVKPDVISLEYLRKMGFETQNGVKIIGKCEISLPINIEAHYFTNGAAGSIKEAGGSTTVIEVKPKVKN